ncbi:hypothetical protein HET69_14215 [Streptomyces sp. CJ_13]|uniref:hypothetical protein n=1 Tax=Streptomyces sp. CJ_13 TaxID=2724943 RepID=UPI001BDCBE3F|nr:hypothetical protein [Streptomyces sp. CJ_13]MBT1185135.1 hypothetical protein [Streptomyces sp. CJ_13]
MNNIKRVTAAIALAGAALSMSAAAHADEPQAKAFFEEREFFETEVIQNDHVGNGHHSTHSRIEEIVDPLRGEAIIFDDENGKKTIEEIKELPDGEMVREEIKELPDGEVVREDFRVN